MSMELGTKEVTAAAAIHDALSILNTALSDACDAGLHVELSTLRGQRIGRYADLLIMQATIEKRTRIL